MSDEGLRARAEKFMEEKLKRMVKFPDDVPGWLADFAQQIREDDCKAVCWLCASDKWKASGLVKREWLHYPVNPVYEGEAVFFKCNAAAIRNLAEKEPKV